MFNWWSLIKLFPVEWDVFTFVALLDLKQVPFPHVHKIHILCVYVMFVCVRTIFSLGSADCIVTESSKL